jgi:hypothetical protein
VGVRTLRGSGKRVKAKIGTAFVHMVLGSVVLHRGVRTMFLQFRSARTAWLLEKLCPDPARGAMMCLPLLAVRYQPRKTLLAALCALSWLKLFSPPPNPDPPPSTLDHSRLFHARHFGTPLRRLWDAVTMHAKTSVNSPLGRWDASFTPSPRDKQSRPPGNPVILKTKGCHKCYRRLGPPNG